MLYSGTDPESYITEYTLVYEDKKGATRLKESEIPVRGWRRAVDAQVMCSGSDAGSCLRLIDSFVTQL